MKRIKCGLLQITSHLIGRMTCPDIRLQHIPPLHSKSAGNDSPDLTCCEEQDCASGKPALHRLKPHWLKRGQYLQIQAP
ncbi:hypothetical protein [Pseudochrobactrum sp. HB0163]|uniref:hypothetical protein n=1 Tax=Pseudochrobactrum sp. HB0163 TaxID=3450708 RepID=UPI003F6DF6ED